MRTMSNTVAVAVVVAFFALIPVQFEAYPSIYPTGTTIYDPEKAWNGYVIFDRPERQGAVLIDMNGNELRHWKEIAQVPGADAYPARRLRCWWRPMAGAASGSTPWSPTPRSRSRSSFPMTKSTR